MEMDDKKNKFDLNVGPVIFRETIYCLEGTSPEKIKSGVCAFLNLTPDQVFFEDCINWILPEDEPSAYNKSLVQVDVADYIGVGEVSSKIQFSIGFRAALAPANYKKEDGLDFIDLEKLSHSIGAPILVPIKYPVIADAYRVFGSDKYPGVFFRGEDRHGYDQWTRIEIPGLDELIPKVKTSADLLEVAKKFAKGDHLSNGPIHLFRSNRYSQFERVISEIQDDADTLLKVAEVFDQAAEADELRTQKAGLSRDLYHDYERLAGVVRERAQFIGGV